MDGGACGIYDEDTLLRPLAATLPNGGTLAHLFHHALRDIVANISNGQVKAGSLVLRSFQRQRRNAPRHHAGGPHQLCRAASTLILQPMMLKFLTPRLEGDLQEFPGSVRPAHVFWRTAPFTAKADWFGRIV